MKKILLLALLLPFFAQAQVNGTLQKTVATGTVRGSFGANGLDTFAVIQKNSLANLDMLRWNSATLKWIPRTPAQVLSDIGAAPASGSASYVPIGRTLTIAGTTQDLSANRTFTIPASSLTGTTLASNVISSSLSTVGTINTGTWNGTLINPSYGGTGVDNTGKSITLGGNLNTSTQVDITGSGPLTLTTTESTNLTLPPSGTLLTTTNVSGTAGNIPVFTATNIVGNSIITQDASTTSIRFNTTGWPTGQFANVANRILMGGSTPVLGIWNDDAAAADNSANLYIGNKTNLGATTFGGGKISGRLYNSSTRAGSLRFETTASNSTAVAMVLDSAQTMQLPAYTSNGVLTTSGGTGKVGVTSTTGTGSVVLATAPTLTGTATITAPVGSIALAINGRASDNTSSLFFYQNNGSTLNSYIQSFSTGGGVLSIGVNGTEALNISSAQIVKIPSLAGTGSRVVVTDASGNLSATQIVTSGTYTPTSSDNVNISSLTVNQFLYKRTGDIVDFSGDVSVQATAGGTVQFRLTLPIASNFANTQDANGGLFGSSQTNAMVWSHDTADKLQVAYTAAGTSLLQYKIVGMYIIK